MTKITPITTAADTRAEISAKTESHPLVPIAIFCLIGLLLSLTVVILDQRMPGEWF